MAQAKRGRAAKNRRRTIASSAGTDPRRRWETAAAAQARQEVFSRLSKPLKDFTPGEMVSVLKAYVARKQELEPNSPAVDDPILGTLTACGDWWEAVPRPVSGFGKTVKVTYDAPRVRGSGRSKADAAILPPTARQRAACRTFFSDPERYRRVVEDANWDFYLVQVFDDDDNYPSAMTRLRHPSSFWKLLSAPRITFPARDDSGSWVEFTWECRWDREHGHKVILRNGKPNCVGQQGGA